MNLENVDKAAVVGVGNMGSQISEIIARLGAQEVHLVDIDKKLVDNAIKSIDDRLERFQVAKGKMTPQQKKEVLARIHGYSDMSAAVKDVQVVVEAVVENLALKKKIFSEVDKYAPLEAIITSNTSFLNITEIAAATKRPDKVVGTHFFNPVSVMKLVEVVKGAMTSKETIDLACNLMRKLGKEPVICRDTSFGFLANRAYYTLSREAQQMVWEKVASPEDIDKALRLGYNLPVGPLELADAIGGWAVAASMEEDSIREMGQEKGSLHPIIKTMLRAGYTGGPGKKGIYDFWKEVASNW